MTPKSKEELREEASELVERIITNYKNWTMGQWNYNGDDPRQVGASEIMQIIATYHQQQLEQAVREARIDERNKERQELLQEYRFTAHNSGSGRQLKSNLTRNADCIAELQSIKENKSNE